ncbi:hypothetical protein B7463_g5716, partial [Scytalidium lignicola]
MMDRVTSDEKGASHQNEFGHGMQVEAMALEAMKDNMTAKVVNPLAGIPRDELMQQVVEFSAKKGLVDMVALLQKGAMVAQGATEFAEMEGLDPDELEVLEFEAKHKWSHPFALYATIFVCSIGAAVQGWDQTGSNGANLSFPQEFGIASGSDRDFWLIGLINAAPYISSALIGCWLSDPVNNVLGRRGAIFVAAIISARDLYYVHSQLVVEHEMAAGSTYITRLTELVTVPRIRRSTVASVVVFIGQQLCGLNIIAFYSSTVFVEAGATVRAALLASLGYGIVNFVFAFPALFMIDKFGRRSLLLSTFPHMAWTLLAAGLCFYIPKSSNAHVGLVAFFVYIFTAFYSVGEGPVAFVYSAEAFPLSHREMGNSWAISVTFALASALSLTFPLMLNRFTPTGAFGFYAGMNILVFILIFLFVPDTSRYTLEELDYIFAVPSRRFISYQFRKVLPWAWKRYVLFKRNEKLEPLFHFERGQEQTNNKSSMQA